MDVATALNELGVEESACKVVGLLPLVYVAWADGKVQKAERDAIMRAAGDMGWLAGGGEAVLERWLQHPPTKAQLETGIRLLNHLARDQADHHFDGDDLHLLLLMCKDVANAAGTVLGIGKAQSFDEIRALETIAAALQIKNARGWRALKPS